MSHINHHNKAPIETCTAWQNLQHEKTHNKQNRQFCLVPHSSKYEIDKSALAHLLCLFNCWKAVYIDRLMKQGSANIWDKSFYSWRFSGITIHWDILNSLLSLFWLSSLFCCWFFLVWTYYIQVPWKARLPTGWIFCKVILNCHVDLWTAESHRVHVPPNRVTDVIQVWQ